LVVVQVVWKTALLFSAVGLLTRPAMVIALPTLLARTVITRTRAHAVA